MKKTYRISIESKVFKDIQEFPTYEDILNSKKIVSQFALKTPLVALNDFESEKQVYLKLEIIQAIGSYKIRGALNMLHYLLSNKQILEKIEQNGIVTASAGNFSQGLAYAMRKLNLNYKLYLVVPHLAAENKLKAVKKIYPLITIIKVSNQQWFNLILTGKFDPDKLDIIEGEKINSSITPFYISPTSGKYVIAGNGTIGLEIYEELKEVDCVIVPYGGGGLSIGIITALKYLNPRIKVFTCELDIAAPLNASIIKNFPQEIEYINSFVDGIGSRTVIPGNFEKIKSMMDGNLLVSLEDIENSIRILIEKNKIISEGAGAASFAAWEKFKDTKLKKFKNVVCIISGGNIDKEKLTKIMQGSCPKF